MLSADLFLPKNNLLRVPSAALRLVGRAVARWFSPSPTALLSPAADLLMAARVEMEEALE